MDERFRNRQRNWRLSDDPADKASAIREAIRYGKLDPKSVQLAAFLGDEGARLVADGVKPTGVVINGKLLKNAEMRDLAEGLTFFGIHAARLVNLGLFRMAINRWTRTWPYYKKHRCALRPIWVGFRYFDWYNNSMREYGQGILIEELFNILESAVKNNQGDRLSTLVQYRVNNFALPSYSYPQYVPEIVGNIAYESVIQSRPRPKLVKFCNGFYSDADMLKYISAEVLPWALGEFYTGPEVEPLNGIMPLAERRLPPK